MYMSSCTLDEVHHLACGEMGIAFSSYICDCAERSVNMIYFSFDLLTHLK